MGTNAGVSPAAMRMRWGAGSLKLWEETAEVEFSTQRNTFLNADEASTLQIQMLGERSASRPVNQERSQALLQAGGTRVCTAE